MMTGHTGDGFGGGAANVDIHNIYNICHIPCKDTFASSGRPPEGVSAYRAFGSQVPRVDPPRDQEADLLLPVALAPLHRADDHRVPPATTRGQDAYLVEDEEL